MMTSRTPKFSSMLAMVSFSFFPYWLVTGLMSAAIILATPDKSTLNINNIIVFDNTGTGTVNVTAGIHWQALRLWWKGATPVRRTTPDGVDERRAHERAAGGPARTDMER